MQREIERTVCRVLNLRYELEKYDRDKVKKVAKDALYAFEKRNKNAPKFSVEVALQHIKMLFKNPTRSSLVWMLSYISVKINPNFCITFLIHSNNVL